MGFISSNAVSIKKAIVLFSLVLIIIAPLVSSIYKETEPIVIVQESPMNGTTGYTVSKTTCNAQRKIIVYNGTVNDPSADWYYDGQYSEVHNGNSGVNVELSGNVTVTSWHSQLSWVRFRGNPTLPLQNYSEVTFLVNIRTLQGSANVTLYGYITSWPDADYYDLGMNATHLEEGESTALVVTITPNEAFNLTPRWIARSNMQLDVTSSEESLIRIGAVLVTADSNEDLYPVTFDMQSPESESLLMNPYMGTLRELGSRTVNGEFSCCPALELSRNNNTTESSILVPRTFNETLYLAAGQYDGIAGWFTQGSDLGGSWSYWLDDSYNISFILEPGDSILIQIRISAYRLTIDLSPSFAYSIVWIDAGTSGFVARYNGDFPLKGIEYLFIPGSTVYSISLGASFLEPTYVFLETNGTTCVHISITYPQVTILGIILDWGQILGLIGAALLFLLVVHGGMRKSFAGIKKDRIRRMNLLPVSLYYVAMFFPWVTYEFETNWSPTITLFAVVMVPILTTLLRSSTSQIVPVPISNWFPMLLPIVLLYWLPILYLSYLVTTSTNPISHELFRQDVHSLLRLVVIGGPFIIGCYYLWLCIIGLCIPYVGLVAALLTLPSWYMVFRTEKQNTHNQSTNNTSLSTQ